tara:strand:+ start:62 stop:451 length:390 start_codon:yes stop_codon:yes gene_type:complete
MSKAIKTTKVLADAAAAARAAANKAARNKLRTGNKAPEGVGKADAGRMALGRAAGRSKGQAKALKTKMIALEKITDKKGEKAQLLRNAINGLKKQLPTPVIKQVQEQVKAAGIRATVNKNKGGMVKRRK